ncbi:MAG: hypothetical protein AAB973_02215 [Patescibacteria group bacterium]
MPNSVWLKKFSLVNNLVGLVFGLVAVLALANLIGTNALATQGVVLDYVLSETGKLNKENQILTVEIGKKANLSNIQSAASDLGFVRVKTNLIISGDEALAAVR